MHMSRRLGWLILLRTCRLGWAGETCKECQVLPGCLHGTCSKPLECKCEKGWTGILCQTPLCAEGCHKERGYCRRPGECRCKVGWWGENCDKCYRYPGCVHGSCQRPWECNCESGWGGMLCDQELNFCDENPNLCENNGTCVSLAEEDGSYRCLCTEIFTGRNCEVNKTQVIGMRPPPLPTTATDREPPTSTLVPYEKESTTKRPSIGNENGTNGTSTVNSTTTSTTNSSTEETENPESAETETTPKPNDVKATSITSSPSPQTTVSAKRASTSRPEVLRRTSATKQKNHRKSRTGEDRPLSADGEVHPNVDGISSQPKLTRTGRFNDWPEANEIPALNRRISIDKVSSSGQRLNLQLNDDGTIEIQQSGKQVRVGNDENGDSFDEEVRGSYVSDNVPVGPMGKYFKPMEGDDFQREDFVIVEGLPMMKSLVNQWGEFSDVISEASAFSGEAVSNLNEAKQDQETQTSKGRRTVRHANVDEFSATEAANGDRKDKAIDSYPGPNQITVEPTAVYEFEDGVIEIRPMKGSDKSWDQKKKTPNVVADKANGKPYDIYQSNDRNSHNSNEASIQMMISNQSQVSGIRYYDSRQNYHIQNMIGHPFVDVLRKGIESSSNPQIRPIINIFINPGAEGCPCKPGKKRDQSTATAAELIEQVMVSGEDGLKANQTADPCKCLDEVNISTPTSDEVQTTMTTSTVKLNKKAETVATPSSGEFGAPGAMNSPQAGHPFSDFLQTLFGPDTAPSERNENPRTSQSHTPRPRNRNPSVSNRRDRGQERGQNQSRNQGQDHSQGRTTPSLRESNVQKISPDEEHLSAPFLDSSLEKRSFTEPSDGPKEVRGLMTDGHFIMSSQSQSMPRPVNVELKLGSVGVVESLDEQAADSSLSLPSYRRQSQRLYTRE